MAKRVSVTKESSTGRNERFHDNYLNKDMTACQFVREIDAGNYHNYHVRNVHGVRTPVSNPDRSTKNNLG